MGELETLQAELEQTKQALQKTERKLEKSQSYNEELRHQIDTLSTELHKYRSAVQSRKDASCQVEEKDIEEAYGDKPFPDWGLPDNDSAAKGTETQTTSIADTLKAAAEEVVWEQAGFVYDSQTGLYYDHNSGYYYDPTRCLYYDPRTSSYFYYDDSAQEYKFHSYASGQQTQEQVHGQENVASRDPAAVTENSAQSAMKEKHHKTKSKKKEKERPKTHKPKRLKDRQRTKESKHKKKKKKSSKKERSRKRTGSDVVLVDSSDDEHPTVEEDAIFNSLVHPATSAVNSTGGCMHKGVNVKQGAREKSKVGGHEGEGEVQDIVMEEAEVEHEPEVISIDSTSDSLATGESEMESEPESGELESSSPSESESETESEAPIEAPHDEIEEDGAAPELSANWPPCVRVIVQKSDVVDEGAFFMVTCMGGTIGREKDSKHFLQVSDVNVSKFHAEIKFDYDNKCYTVQDLGSQNGTFVNDLRISETKVQSASVPLCHGDTLQVASTRMLLHIHPGTDTCDACEPGQVQAALRAQQTVVNDHVVLTKEEKLQQARRNLKELKKKYGLANAAYVDNVAAIKNPDYADKADLRRKFVGSEHPSHQHRDETPASVHRPISTENKGHRMLAKMGWKEGSGLGKDSAGIAEPVSVELRANQTAGLGSASAVNLSLDDVQSARKAQRWAQTQQRYHSLNKGDVPAPSVDTVTRTIQNSGDSQSVDAGSSSSSTQANTRAANGGAISNPGANSSKLQFKWVKGGTHKPP